MPSPDDDLEPRVRHLEAEVGRPREEIATTRSESAAARVLAGGADRDVSEVRAELRAHLQALNALRETQIEQGHKSDALQAELTAEIGSARSEMQQGFGMVQTGMAQITALLRGLEGPDPA